MERDVRQNSMFFSKEQCRSLTWFTAVVIVLVVLSTSSNALSFTYSREWSPSSTMYFSWNELFCLEHPSFQCESMFNVFALKMKTSVWLLCLMLRIRSVSYAEVPSLVTRNLTQFYSQDILAYKIGKLLTLINLVEYFNAFNTSSNDNYYDSDPPWRASFSSTIHFPRTHNFTTFWSRKTYPK